ncbi:MAG: acyltransferase [Woeseiaceae bacterium]|nr:acyltransferase [Woeseiaceae bacterium]
MRSLIKDGINLLCLVLMLPLSLPTRVFAAEGRPSVLFTILCHTLSLFPGVIGVYLRRGYYRIAFEECGSDVAIGFGTVFAMRGTRIGRDTYIGTHCTVGLAHIGESVLIGSNVDIIGGPQVHHFDQTDVPIKQQGGTMTAVHVGNGSWLGNSAVVMADVGEECVVGAGSVVVNTCDDWGIYVGNPARRVRDRRESAEGAE